MHSDKNHIICTLKALQLQLFERYDCRKEYIATIHMYHRWYTTFVMKDTNVPPVVHNELNVLNCVAGSVAVLPPTPARMRGRPRSRRGSRGCPTRQLGIPSDPAAAVIPSDNGIFQPPSQWQGNTCIAPAAPTFIGRRQHHLPAADMSPLDVVRLFLDDRFFLDDRRSCCCHQ